MAEEYGEFLMSFDNREFPKHYAVTYYASGETRSQRVLGDSSDCCGVVGSFTTCDWPISSRSDIQDFKVRNIHYFLSY